MSSKITLYVETEHTCGHIHTSVYHMDEATIDVCIKADYPEFEITKDFIMQTEIEQERSLKLSGSFDKVEIHMCACALGKKYNWMQKLYRQLVNWTRKDNNKWHNLSH